MSEHDELSMGADVDVQAIMAEVRAEVSRKRELGLYPPDVLAELDVAFGTDGPGDGDLFRRALLDLQRSAGFSPDITIASQKPVVAPVVSRTKQVIRASVRWYLAGILQQVQGFAGNAVRVVGLLADRLVRLEGELADWRQSAVDEIHGVKEQLAEIQRSLHDVRRRVEVDRATDRLAQLERALRTLRERLEERAPAAPAPGALAQATAAHVPRSWEAERTLNYFEFENRFRGASEDVRKKQIGYVELFREAPGPVADLGCGRGEFLALLAEARIEAYGVDRHPDMVAQCREQGLRVEQADILDHLASVPPASLGGVFAAQVVEHLDPADVVHFFELAAGAIAPGGVLVAETINPQSLFVFAGAFYVDLGHLRPLHPLTLRFLAETSGFSDVDLEYSTPPSPEFRPQPVEPTGDDRLDATIEAVNENFRRIDDLVFGPQDYAVVARR